MKILRVFACIATLGAPAVFAQEPALLASESACIENPSEGCILQISFSHAIADDYSPTHSREFALIEAASAYVGFLARTGNILEADSIIDTLVRRPASPFAQGDTVAGNARASLMRELVLRGAQPSVIEILSSNLDDSERVSTLTNVAVALIESNSDQGSDEYLLAANSVIAKMQRSDALIVSLVLVATRLLEIDRDEAAREYLMAAREIYEDQSVTKEIYTPHLLNQSLARSGLIEDAVAMESSSRRNVATQSVIFEEIANQRSLDEAIDYAVNLLTDGQFSELPYFGEIFIARRLASIGDVDRALQFVSNLSDAEIRFGAIQDVYVEAYLGDNEFDALHYLEQSRILVESGQSSITIPDGYKILVSAYARIDEPDIALEMASLLRAASPSINDSYFTNIVRSFARSGQFAKASEIAMSIENDLSRVIALVDIAWQLSN